MGKEEACEMGAEDGVLTAGIEGLRIKRYELGIRSSSLPLDGGGLGWG
jgi:hypothetical protein